MFASTLLSTLIAISSAVSPDMVTASMDMSTKAQYAEALAYEQSGLSVNVIMTDDERNCGTHRLGVLGGCYHPETPGTIYVSPDLTGHALEYVVRHETAHVMQHMVGGPFDECEADAVAEVHGADLRYSVYSQDGTC